MTETRELKKQTEAFSSFSKKTSREKIESSRQAEERPDSNLFFQRNLGNIFMQSVVEGQNGMLNATPNIQRNYSCGDSCSNRIQAKLIIGPANDVYEQEADQAAEKVMRMPESSVNLVNGQPNEKIKIQRTSSKHYGTLTSDQNIKLNGSSGSLLSSSIRKYMEPRFGTDFSHVRVHSDEKAHQTATQIQAKAFTYGNHIWLGKGEREQNRKLMAHELAHVVQQQAATPINKSNSHAEIGKMTVPQIQLARLPCYSRRRIDVFGVNLPGSTGNINNDVANANSILCQCGIELNVAGGQSVITNVLNLDPPAGTLTASGATPSRELSQMLQIRPGGSMIHVYYIPAITSGGLGTSVGSTRFTPSLPDSVIITNSAIPAVFPHELGHVLLDSGAHHSNRDNLMASGSVNTGAGELEQQQCNQMP
ncbi:MAG: DUF4157 domain-containing protein [Desulfobacteraceae bacterium]